jgi:undecaprenyl-diphosphatase
MYELDVSMTQAINALSGQWAGVDHFMIWFSALGVPLLVLVLASQWWRRGERLHIRHVLVASGLSFVFGLLINQALLLLVHRMRPYDAGVTHLLIAPSADYSFPSDHATATFAIAAAFLAHGLRRVGAWLFAAAVLMALSRVFVGTHFLTDVIGGAFTGIIAAAIVRATYREGTRFDRTVTRLF